MKNKIKTVFSPNATSQLIVEEAIKHIKKKMDVLDLGCGNGYIGLNIYKKKKDKIREVKTEIPKLVEQIKKDFMQNILLLLNSPLISLTFLSLFINNVASSFILLFSLSAKL